MENFRSKGSRIKQGERSTDGKEDGQRSTKVSNVNFTNPSSTNVEISRIEGNSSGENEECRTSMKVNFEEARKIAHTFVSVSRLFSFYSSEGRCETKIERGSIGDKQTFNGHTETPTDGICFQDHVLGTYGEREFIVKRIDKTVGDKGVITSSNVLFAVVPDKIKMIRSVGGSALIYTKNGKFLRVDIGECSRQYFEIQKSNNDGQYTPERANPGAPLSLNEEIDGVELLCIRENVNAFHGFGRTQDAILLLMEDCIIATDASTMKKDLFTIPVTGGCHIEDLEHNNMIIGRNNMTSYVILKILVDEMGRPFTSKRPRIFNLDVIEDKGKNYMAVHPDGFVIISNPSKQEIALIMLEGEERVMNIPNMRPQVFMKPVLVRSYKTMNAVHKIGPRPYTNPQKWMENLLFFFGTNHNGVTSNWIDVKAMKEFGKRKKENLESPNPVKEQQQQPPTMNNNIAQIKRKKKKNPVVPSTVHTTEIVSAPKRRTSSSSSSSSTSEIPGSPIDKWLENPGPTSSTSLSSAFVFSGAGSTNIWGNSAVTTNSLGTGGLLLPPPFIVGGGEEEETEGEDEKKNQKKRRNKKRKRKRKKKKVFVNPEDREQEFLAIEIGKRQAERQRYEYQLSAIESAIRSGSDNVIMCLFHIFNKNHDLNKALKQLTNNNEKRFRRLVLFTTNKVEEILMLMIKLYNDGEANPDRLSWRTLKLMSPWIGNMDCPSFHKAYLRKYFLHVHELRDAEEKNILLNRMVMVLQVNNRGDFLDAGFQLVGAVMLVVLRQWGLQGHALYTAYAGLMSHLNYIEIRQEIQIKPLLVNHCDQMCTMIEQYFSTIMGFLRDASLLLVEYMKKRVRITEFVDFLSKNKRIHINEKDVAIKQLRVLNDQSNEDMRNIREFVNEKVIRRLKMKDEEWLIRSVFRHDFFTALTNSLPKCTTVVIDQEHAWRNITGHIKASICERMRVYFKKLDRTYMRVLTFQKQHEIEMPLIKKWLLYFRTK